ncbi:MAG: hypothetical protein J6D52_10045, partial [Clostridia bacterium]|nr:hypothetical protein [Clostridia bacterium]
GATIFLPEDPPSTFSSLSVNNCRKKVYDCAFKNQMEIIIPGKPKRTLVATGENSYSISDNTTNILPANFTLNKFPQLKLDFKNLDTDKYYNDNDTENDSSSTKHNNSSLCCIMTFGKTRIGLFGDIGNKAQEHLYHNEEIGHLDLMSVEHHGKNGGFYRPFYDAIAPKMCFTQDGSGLTDAGGCLLAEKSKTQAYLQECGIPNYAVSINGAMTFDIYKSGISTKEKAIKYAQGIKGVTSFMGAINNSISTPKTKTRLNTLLKNMEHGTFLSTLIKSEECHSDVWNDLVAPFVGPKVSAAELILYKGGSTYENQSAEPTSNAGYIILIPHSSNKTTGNIMGYWYTTYVTDYSNIKVVLKQSSVDIMKEYDYTNANIPNIYPSYNSYPMF